MANPRGACIQTSASSVYPILATDWQELVKERGLNVFARIDHAAGAAKIGKTLRPTELLTFGNPQGGTPFMECAQTVAIDQVARQTPSFRSGRIARVAKPPYVRSV
ncbi:DUF302 domain-containing protein [Thiothrix litoralis]|uniref:DUF302 domain-containing protein n=1 Tax=Thiothrix litoralis TaxID=2891210 RepID=A0ABX7WPX9_9GAMM|nr:DUF302 domain-containing protein [Thiothrix litoralis]QTR45640.1 DUF302 domain-containing protein [Thiothrix litoralis]